eukprot:m.172164 g.172164  ORF g.172164 m.172164 type:complete len:163 (-) comp10395_c0_seq23:14-502(-)
MRATATQMRERSRPTRAAAYEIRNRLYPLMVAAHMYVHRALQAFSFESPLGTYLGSLRMALEMALSRLIRAFPQQTERALGSLEKSDGERLRSFLAAHEGLLDGMARTITQPHMPWAHSQPGPTSHGSPGPRSPLAAVGAGGAGDRWQSPPARSPYLRGLRT